MVFWIKFSFMLCKEMEFQQEEDGGDLRILFFCFVFLMHLLSVLEYET